MEGQHPWWVRGEGWDGGAVGGVVARSPPTGYPMGALPRRLGEGKDGERILSGIFGLSSST